MASSQLEAFLESMAGECDEKALRAIKAHEIFYPVCSTLVFLSGNVTNTSTWFVRTYVCFLQEFSYACVSRRADCISM